MPASLRQKSALSSENATSIRLRPPLNRLMTGRPHCAATHVAQVNKGAPVISGHIFAPASYGVLAAVGISCSGSGDHDVVSAIRKQLRARCFQICGVVNAGDHSRQRLDHATRQHFFRARMRRGHAHRDSFLQEQFGGPHDRIGMKAILHATVCKAY